MVADLQVEPGEQRVVDRRAVDAVLPRSASSGGMAGANSASPTRGHDGSTAFTSTRAASPSSARAIARIVAIVESVPRAARKALVRPRGRDG